MVESTVADRIGPDTPVYFGEPTDFTIPRGTIGYPGKHLKYIFATLFRDLRPRSMPGRGFLDTNVPVRRGAICALVARA